DGYGVRAARRRCLMMRYLVARHPEFQRDMDRLANGLQSLEGGKGGRVRRYFNRLWRALRGRWSLAGPVGGKGGRGVSIWSRARSAVPTICAAVGSAELTPCAEGDVSAASATGPDPRAYPRPSIPSSRERP